MDEHQGEGPGQDSAKLQATQAAADAADVDGSRAKAEVRERIARLIKQHHLSPARAAQIVRLPQSALAALLRGEHKDVSVARMNEYLGRLKNWSDGDPHALDR